MEDFCNGSVVWVSFHNWVHSFSRSTDVHKSMRVIEVKHRASVKGNPSPSPQKMIKFDLKELFGTWYQCDICLCIALKKCKLCWHQIKYIYLSWAVIIHVYYSYYEKNVSIASGI